MAVCAIFLGAAFVQATLGFGFALVSMTVLALVHDVPHAAAVVNITGSVLILAMSAALREAIAWSYVRRVLPWAVPGVLAGVWLLDVLDRDVAVRLLGASVGCIAVWNLVAHPAPSGPPRPLWEALAGLASGTLTGAFNQGGPPLIAHLYHRDYPPDALKGTAQAIFLITGLVRLPVAAAHGHVSAAVLREAAVGLPFVALGMAAGLRAARHLDAARFRRLSWTALLGLGVYLTIHA
jgi:uncharacterized membrane protein YfcA